MKLPATSFLLAFTLAVAAGAQTTTVMTIKKSAVLIGSGSFALPKGTRLEMLGLEGDQLVVKFRTLQGKIPAADTDFSPEAATTQATAAPAAAVSIAPSPQPVVPAKSPATPAPKPAANRPPAATVYGKAVQKAKQAAEAHEGTHVDPTQAIMDAAQKK